MKAITLALLLTATTSAADARVTRIEIGKREPFAAGQAFGSTGAYEKIVGRYHGALDPSHPLNATIVDLDKAPRNAQGQVEYTADFYILRPARRSSPASTMPAPAATIPRPPSTPATAF